MSDHRELVKQIRMHLNAEYYVVIKNNVLSEVC